MFFYSTTNTTPIEGYWYNIFNLYKSKIYTLTALLVKEESLWGRSCVQYKLQQYNLAFYYALLIYLDWSSGVYTDWDELESKYDLTEIRKKFACSGIRFNDVLDEFNLPYDSSDGVIGLGAYPTYIAGVHGGREGAGINYINVDSKFTVQPSHVTTHLFVRPHIDAAILLALDNTCVLADDYETIGL